ncbi:MAG TPA: tetratricopeptide repeat protein [Bryobacteraceae bacterium]|nr:tetratricopeptide repeat protein [Bryobacteraceae bacterium]
MASNLRQKPGQKRAAPAPVSGQGAGTAVAAQSAPIAAAAAPRTTAGQKEQFDLAFGAFHARKYAEALPLFEAASQGPHLAMAHTAGVYTRMCSERIAASQPKLSTPEDLYNFAVALMNARQFAEAEKHLSQALHLAPSGDHVFYALALCRGLTGDLAGARKCLQRAIELNPRNRYAARNDPDFAELGKLSPIADLLYPGTIGAQFRP